MLLLAATARGLVLSSGLTVPARASVCTAALSESPIATGEFPADLSALSRRELQSLAKRVGVRANQKSVDMVAELEALMQRSESEISDERNEASAPERRSQARAPERRDVSATARHEVSPSRRRSAATPDPALPPASVRQGSLSLVERTLPPMLTRSSRLRGPSSWRHCAAAWHPGPGSPGSRLRHHALGTSGGG